MDGGFAESAFSTVVYTGLGCSLELYRSAAPSPLNVFGTHE